MISENAMPFELRYINIWEIISAPSSTILFLDNVNSKLYSIYLLSAKCSFYCILLLYPDPVSFFLRMWF